VTAGEAAKPIATCPLCAATYDLQSGVKGEVVKQNSLKGMFAGLMAQADPKDLTAYETRITSEGAVLVRMD
jgi:nitrite reductase/ring-hydroxylating ferredoxin subunit